MCHDLVGWFHLTLEPVSPTSLSGMETYDVKNSYNPHVTRVYHGREWYLNSIR
jgi:hypothetical protein